jgi:tRNA-2-methylthio-N6-dimethylallyladenosine synthase
VEVQNRLSLQSNQLDIGKSFKVLIEGNSRKSDLDWRGRNSQNKVMVFPKGNFELKKGDYVTVTVTGCTQGTLIGHVLQ